MEYLSEIFNYWNYIIVGIIIYIVSYHYFSTTGNLKYLISNQILKDLKQEYYKDHVLKKWIVLLIMYFAGFFIILGRIFYRPYFLFLNWIKKMSIIISIQDKDIKELWLKKIKEEKEF